MNILVTGGAGFIGSHVVDAFVQSGHKVAVVDDLSTGRVENINSQASFLHLNICSSELSSAISSFLPDVICHHAAQVSVPLSVMKPLSDAQTNVIGLLNVLESAVHNKVRKVIYVSSGGAMYGEPVVLPTPEDYPPVPLSVYAIHKLTGEHYLQYYHHQYGLDYTVLRYANVYGPRQVAQGEAGVVAIFIQQLLNGESVTINRYEDQPEGMIRDYVYVADVVKANLLALSKGSRMAFNIGTCRPTSTLDLYRDISNLLGIVRYPIIASARAGDIRRSLLDITKAKSELDWVPDWDLKSGLLKTIEFFKNQ